MSVPAKKYVVGKHEDVVNKYGYQVIRYERLLLVLPSSYFLSLSLSYCPNHRSESFCFSRTPNDTFTDAWQISSSGRSLSYFIQEHGKDVDTRLILDVFRNVRIALGSDSGRGGAGVVYNSATEATEGKSRCSLTNLVVPETACSLYT